MHPSHVDVVQPLLSAFDEVTLMWTRWSDERTTINTNAFAVVVVVDDRGRWIVAVS